MTRINCGVAVEQLTDEHLLAEHRELKRFPSVFIKSLKSGSINKIPKEFCLGKGHVLFFLNKQKYIYIRYATIYCECLRRGFNVINYSDNWHDILDLLKEQNCWNGYFPAFEGNLVIDRIIERIEKSSKTTWHYYGKPISKEEAIGKLIKR